MEDITIQNDKSGNAIKNRDGKVTQITIANDRIYIEITGLFTNLDKVIKKYTEQGYSKDNINISILDYRNVMLPLTFLEKMKEQLNILTSNVNENDSQIEKFTKIALSIRKNISYAFEKTKNRNVGESKNFIEGLINGRCVCSDYSLIMKAALELHGIDSRIVSSDRHSWNIVNLNNGWYHWDMTNTKSEVLSVNNIGKCLKSDSQLEKKKIYLNNDSTIKCENKPSKDLINQINEIARRVKYDIPTMPKQRISFLEKFRTLFIKKEEKVLALPKAKEKEMLNILSSSALGMIKDDILWEIQTWDKSDVHNKICTAYVGLPKIGSPKDIFLKNPEMFTKLYLKLLDDSEKESVPFLGSINYDKERNAFTANSIESQEMKDVKNVAYELIRKRTESVKAEKVSYENNHKNVDKNKERE